MLEADARRRMEFRFFFIYVALFTPYAVVTPYLQQLLHLYGFHHDQIGYILGAIELMAVLAPPIWGILSDKCGKPRAVLMGCILLSIPAILLLRPGQGTLLAVAIGILFGLFNKPTIPLTDGLTFSHFRLNGCDYGHVRIGGTLGFITMLILFERIFHISTDQDGTRIMAILVGSLVFFALMVTTIPRLDTPVLRQRRESIPFRTLLTPTFLFLILASFLQRFAMMSYYSFFTRYLNEVYHFQAVGYIWLLGSVCEFPVIFWSQRILKRIGIKKLYLLALFGTFLRLFGLAFETNLYVSMAMQTLHCLTFGAFHIATVTYVSRAFPARFQGSAQTIFSAATVGLGGLLGSCIGGIILEHCGYFVLYRSFCAVALLALCIALPLKLNIKSESAN